ncbi:F-box only protein 40 isoform X1 [Garra rufa]|uniref:F-box only protein 40 isoform X1 n=1 Tax=Garra rufa TaxID=137080 RepID=UPI003CCE9873
MNSVLVFMRFQFGTSASCFVVLVYCVFPQSRYRRSGPRLHRHCETCYSRRCKASIEVSVSCMVINCRLLCGASFHMCKEDEHSLLCPNEKVPCLNAHYGCPFTMCRSRLAKHLEVCPASVVCCSMEWIRWPLENPDAPLYTNLLKELHEQESLDLSMALRDQKHLCARLKMRRCFPELMEEQEEEPAPVEEYDDEDGAVGKEIVCNGIHINGLGDSGGGLVNGPACEKALKDDVVLNGPVDKEKYNLFEKMFSMEMGGCKQAEAKVEASKAKEKTGEKSSSKGSSKSQGASVEPEKKEANVSPVDTTKTGLAPWQDGVLERLGQEVKPREFNMYVVHHGRMLIAFGQMDACTPRERDFVYGSLEPIPVQTLHSTYKAPTSYRQKRIQLREFNARVLTEHKCVGTSDLDLPEKDGGEMDEMFSTLLCYAETEIRGHKISETVPTDGLYIDIATQTYNFTTAPFKYNATLTDITEGRDLKLHVDLDTETVTLRHNKSTSTFTFMCGHFFRRDEIASHFKNVHLDIQSGLSGWFEQRCPLAYLGCTFSQRRLQPSTQRAKVSYNQDLSIFTLTPEVPVSLMSDSQTVSLKACVKYEDSLSNLPFEVLCHIASYLDSFTLSQLALVSRLFRDICATFLQERGMVGFKWCKKSYSHGGARWKPTKVWEFSTLFSKVGNWCIGDAPSMAEHLKHCPFYQTELKTKPFALASMFDEKGKERQNLVSLFMGHK